MPANSDELLAQRQEILALGKKDIGGVLRSKIHALQRPLAIANYDPQRAQEVLDVLAKNDTWQIPTLASGYWISPKDLLPVPNGKRLLNIYHEAIERSWKNEIEQLLATAPTPFNETLHPVVYQHGGPSAPHRY